MSTLICWKVEKIGMRAAAAQDLVKAEDEGSIEILETFKAKS